MKKMVSLILALIMVVGLVACGNSTSPGGSASTSTPDTSSSQPAGSQGATETVANAERYGGVLNLCYRGSASDTVDPYDGGWTTYIWGSNVYENFLTRDADGNYQPGVCNFELSEDQKTIRFWVRDGVTFHDGTPVTVEDLEASLLYNPETHLNDPFWEILESIEADTSTGILTIKMKEYHTGTLYQLSNANTYTVIMPKRILEKYLSTDGSKREKIPLEDIVGTGPYKVNKEESTPGTVIVLERFEDYVQKDENLTGMAGPRYAYLDRINVYWQKEKNTLSMALLSGTYDVASISAEYDEVLVAGGLEQTDNPVNNIYYLAFNTHESRPTADENLRKAIAAAIDYETLMKVVNTSYDLDPCPTVKGGYYTTVFAEQDYYGAANVTLAKEYLAKSNYKGEEIIIASTSSSKAGTVVEPMLAEAGIKVKIEYMDSSAMSSLYGNLAQANADMFFLSSAHAEGAPTSLVTNLRYRFWLNNPNAKDMYSALGQYVYMSEDSLKAWETYSTTWAEDAHIVLFGSVMSSYSHNPDLNCNFPEGPWTVFYNAYWDNPSEHQS